MARALELQGANEILQTHREMTVTKGAFTYRIVTRGEITTYSVSDDAAEIAAPLKWSFGEHDQTYVLEYAGRMYESLVSYYSDIQGLDTTLGDQDFRPKTLLQAFGREIDGHSPEGCFGCHSSRGLEHNSISFRSMAPGVTCDRCHTGALQHQEIALQGKLNSVPPRLTGKRPFEISELCGQCHRTWDEVMRVPNPGIVDVRFQPYRLANSKCYDGGDKRLSCVTCHNPHDSAMPTPAAVDAKCMACHSTNSATNSTAKSATGATAFAKVCSVATSGCAGCHMPKIALPGGHKVATDHEIRIVRAGQPFPD